MFEVPLFSSSLQRSYRPELFDDAIRKMQKAMIKSSAEIEHFRQIKLKVDKIVKEKATVEEDYGDVPDEFKGW